MNQNVGASFALSVLTVLFFAVALYQPDKPGAASPILPSLAESAIEPVEALAPIDSGHRPASSNLPVFTRPTSRVTHPGERSDPIVSSSSRAVSGRRGDQARLVGLERTPARKSSIPPDMEGVRGGFTQVRGGESLSDVASRVYGNSNAAENLWLANRDILDRADVPLRDGSILRTP